MLQLAPEERLIETLRVWKGKLAPQFSWEKFLSSGIPTDPS
jgi:hypothetical protein